MVESSFFLLGRLQTVCRLNLPPLVFFYTFFLDILPLRNLLPLELQKGVSEPPLPTHIGFINPWQGTWVFMASGLGHCMSSAPCRDELTVHFFDDFDIIYCETGGLCGPHFSA